MLKEWRLYQFKSVAGKARLRLGPLTVFTGANSSGKSSIVQSILLLAQTQTSKVTDRALVLNGELAKLGTFDDVLHDRAPEREIGLGFTLSMPLAALNAAASRLSHGFYYTGFLWPEEDTDTGAEFDVDLLFAPIDATRGGEKAESLQAQLRNAELTTRLYKVGRNPARPSAPESELRISVTRRSDQEIQDLVSENSLQMSSGTTTEMLRYMVNSPVDLASRVSQFGARNRAVGKPRVIASDLEHFLPIRLLTLYEKTPREVVGILDELLEQGPQKHERLVTEWSKSGDRNRVAVANAIKKIGGENLQAALSKLKTLLRHRYAFAEDPTAKQIIQLAVEELSRETRRQVGIEFAPLPPEQAFLRQAVLTCFGTGIRYLGPLRDDPKPVYAVPTGSDPSYVGIKGEFTASVLDLYGQKHVDFVPPESPNNAPTTIPLSVAVSTWVKYLDIADSFSTRDEGKLGHRIFIQPGGIQRNVDLTNVGVGVSQILPIVVTAFISEPGATLLFEQPELHLHPKVQLRLADFFLALIRTGRQCIIETHSEYLINRLRLRVAESPLGSTINDDIALYFVERKSGSSSFREVKINEYGAIPQWPFGFFDQGPEESDRIVEAATRKRALLSKERGK
jgi:predicted ATPase